MKAVLLLTMGGPRSAGDVFPFLFRLFNDPAILPLPSFFRTPLAAVLTCFRFLKAKKMYALLGGFSPAMENTTKQAALLEQALGEDWRCFVGALYTKPSVKEAIRQIKKEGGKDVVLVPLYPQFSTTTSVPALLLAEKEWRFCGGGGKVKKVDSFPVLEGFIESLSLGLEKERERARQQTSQEPKILFSAHGLPERIVKAGDHYPEACVKTVQAIISRNGLQEADYLLCYQSRVGPVRWIGPHLQKEILKAAQQKKPLIVVPVSFVTEHVETLVELDMEGRQLAEKAGAPFWGRVKTPSFQDVFIRSLGKKILEINEKT